MATLLSLLREKRPELTFDGKGNLIEDDKELVDSLLKRFPAKERENLRPYLYAPLPEESANSQLVDTVAGFGKDLLGAVGPTVGAPKDETGTTPSLEEERANSTETVAERIRRTNPRLSKASDTGLARYLKVEQGDLRPMDKIADSLNERYVDKLDKLIKENSPKERAKEKAEAISSTRAVDERLASGFDLEAQARRTQLAEGIAGGGPSLDTITRAEDIFGGVVDLGLKASGQLAATTLGLGGDTLASAATPQLEEDLNRIRRESLGEYLGAQTGGARVTEADIKADTERKFTDEFGDTRLNARDSINARTDRAVEAVTAGADVREARASALRSTAVADFTKAIDSAKTYPEVRAAIADLTVEMSTTPEGLFILAESIPILLGTATNPVVGGFLTNSMTRLGEAQRGKSGDERRASLDEDLKTGAVAGAVDTIAVAAGVRLAKAQASKVAKVPGVLGLGAGGEAGGDFAANPNASRGELAASAALGLGFGATEVGGAVAAAPPTTPRRSTISELQDLQAKAEKVRALRSTGDPLDSAEANLLETPPPNLSEERETGVQQQELPLTGGEAPPARDIEADARALVARQKEQVTQEREALESDLLTRYDEAVSSGDAVEEARVEKALDALTSPETAVEQPSPTGTDQLELQLEGGQQPSQNLERPVSRPKLEEKRSAVTPALIVKSYKDLTNDKYKLKPSDVKTIRQQAEKEGGDPSLPPRELFSRLTESGQDQVINAVAQSRTRVTKVVPKDRVARIAALNTPPNKETASTPSKQEGATPTIPQQESVQQTSSQRVSEAPKAVDTVGLAAAIETLPRGRFLAEIKKAQRSDLSSEQAVQRARDVFAKEELSLPVEAQTLIKDLGLPKGEDVNLDAVKADEVKPLPPIEGAPSIVNKVRTEKGIDFTPTSTPNTAQAKAATQLAKTFGLNLTWVTSPNADQRGAQSGRDIAVNVSSDKPILKVLGHEVNHALERKSEYAARVKQALATYKNQKGLQLEKAKKRVAKYEVNKLEEEVRSDLFGEALEDPGFFRALRKITGDDTLYDKIVTFIQDVVQRFTGKVARLDKVVGEASAATLNGDVQSFRRSLLDAVEASKTQEVTPADNGDVNLDEGAPTRSDVARKAAPVTQQLKSKAKRALSTAAQEALKLTRAQGVASKDTHNASLDLVRGKTALTKEHERLAHKLRITAKRHKVTPRDLDQMLKGRLESNVPSVRHAVGAVRNEIDALTQKLLDLGTVKKEDIKKFKDRMAAGAGDENYVHRSYRAWLDKPGKWATHLKDTKALYWESVLGNIESSLAIPQDLHTTRKVTIDRLASWWDVEGNLTKDEKIAALEQKRDGLSDEAKLGVYKSIREKLADPKGKGTDFVKTYVDAFQSSNKILQERSRLPSWLKEFWGEVEDGTFNALTTMEVQANLLQHAVVMEKMAYDLVENDLASDTERPGYTKVKDGGPLSGLWVKDSELEHMGMINSTLQNVQDAIADNIVIGRFAQGLHSGVLKFTSAAKTAQVIGDVSTMTVQAVSNLGFSTFFSGQIPNPKQLLTGLRAALLDTAYHQDWAGDKAARDKLLRLVELGIASEGAYSSELRAAVHELMGKTLPDGEKIIGTDVEAQTKAFVGLVKKGAGVFTEAGKKTFQFTDTFSRTVAYEIENDRMKRWYPEKTTAEQEQLAAERVRATWPTNSETAPIARWVGKWGILQPFATFMWENHRNILNNTMIGLHDMKNGASLDQKRQGVQRVIASAAAMSGWGFVSSLLGNLLRDEEDQPVDQEDLSVLVPYYYENSPFIEGAGVDENNVLTYYNTGRFNMYEPVSKLVTNSLRGDFDKAAEGWIEDVVAIGFVGELGLGLTDYVSATVKDNDKDKNVAWSDIKRSLQSLIPGTGKRGGIKPEARERMGSPMSTDEKLLELTGFTQHRSKLEVAAGRELRNWSTNSSFVRKDGTEDLLSPDVYDPVTLLTTDGSPPTQEQVDDMYREWAERDRDAFNEASEALQVLSKYLSRADLEAIRKEANVSAEKLAYLLSGKYELPLPNDSGVVGRDFYLLGERQETKQADNDNKEFRENARKKWQALRRQIPRARRNLQRELEER